VKRLFFALETTPEHLLVGNITKKLPIKRWVLTFLVGDITKTMRITVGEITKNMSLGG
jgi:hypothetical protein